MRKVMAAAVAVVAVGAIAATVDLAALHDEPRVLQAPSDEVVEIRPDGLDRAPGRLDGPVTMDPENPLQCMVNLDCLLNEVDAAAPVSPRLVPVVGVAPSTPETAHPLPSTG